MAALMSMKQVSKLVSHNTTRLLSLSAIREIDTSVIPVRLDEDRTIQVKGQDSVGVISGIPQDELVERRVRIFSPARNAMQSGSYGTRRWKIEFDTKERWENPLMGWASNADPMSNLNVDFLSAEDAVDYCEKMGYQYLVEEKQIRKAKAKSYALNFSWNKRSRRSCK